ncbi:hypothetical protein D3C86_1682360 [compost metagenome]
MENGRAETGSRSRRLGIYLKLLRIEENLSAAWQRLSGIYVENLPWLECAERYVPILSTTWPAVLADRRLWCGLSI